MGNLDERYTVKVAVHLLLLKDDMVLLTKRKNTGWMDGDYNLPSGHVEPNEKFLMQW